MKKSKSPKTEAKKALAKKPERKDGFLIVGIGASAGGVQALKTFFENVPANSNAAYVVILHLSPDHDSQLTEILRTVAAIPVERIEEKVKVEANRVYVVSPNESLSMRDGEIIVSPIHTFEERRAPVDIFFRTLAESHCARAVAVILSGTGADGSMGIKRVKENGGAAFVQNPREARFSEMPLNSIATELIDRILNVAEIPAKIVAYGENRGKTIIPVEPEKREEEQQQALREVFTNLRVRTGHDFSSYKRPTVLRRIERRINVRSLPDLPAYADYLKENADETNALLKDLLISVTNFFRDKEAFDYLEREIIPKILAGKKSGDQVRVWVAGCATGEEAYSLAMLLAEQSANVLDSPAIQIFATDIDDAAISAAREGFYTLNDAADVSPERLGRFFIEEPGGFRIRRELREKILFANHNLLKDPAFSRLDLVTCRNLLIYFNQQAQERVMETFHFALKPGAFLFLGTSESVDGASDLYAPASLEQHIHQSRAVAPRLVRAVPDTLPSIRFSQPFPPPAQNRESNNARPFERPSYGDLHHRILEQYAPPSLIVNEKFDIVHVSPRAGHYLQISGEVSNNLFNLIRPDLRLELSTAVYQAVQRQTNVEAKNLQFQIKDQVESVNITVRPVSRLTDDAARNYVLIIFEPTTNAPADTEAVFTADEPVARQLEEELMRSQTRFRQSVEQSEVQAEELKASNEELQAMNEEMRSTTEELETGKEELQSVNEELVTVNQELKIKIEEISQSNNDFQNLINSTDIGTIFLDRNGRVKMFTPAAREIFNLIPADDGRLLSDITHRLEYENLIADVEFVLSKLQSVEREVSISDGSVYLMRVTPYRTADDRIGGTIIAFVNITTRKRQEDELRGLTTRIEKQAQIFDRTLSTITDFAYIFDKEGRFVYSNRPLLDLLGITLEEIIGKNFFDLNYPEDLAARLQQQIQQVFETFAPVKGETPFTGANGAEGFYEYIFNPVFAADGAVESVAGSTRDITTRKQRELNFVFTAEISRDLASLQGIDEIMKSVGAKIGAYLKLSVCAFVEVSETEDAAEINHAWHRKDVPNVRGEYRFSEYLSDEFQQAGRAGEIFAVADTQTDPRSDSDAYAALKIGSFISVPLLKNDEWRFLLVAYHSEAHDWQADEINLIRDLTTRVWTRLERARIDRELIESEEKYRGLFDSIDEGFCVIEMLYDEAGKPFNYRFLETNPIFEKQSGISGAAGKTISEIVPGIEDEWLETYGRVALTREAERFENYAAPLDAWFECYAFPTDAPEKNRVAVLFKDVTTRKRTEANLFFLAEFSRDLITLSDEAAVVKNFGEKINRLTNASMCAFFEINETKEECVCDDDWHRADGPTMVGTYDMREFVTNEFQKMMSAGKAVVVPDVETDAHVRDKGKFAALQIGAFVNVPLIRDGEWRFALGVYHEQPYDWREDELDLLRESASRIWTKIESIRHEKALREAEDRQRLVIEAAEMGTWDWDLTTDEVRWNERHFILFGMKPQKNPIAAEKFFDHIYEDDRAMVTERLQKSVADKTVFQAEFRARLETGEIRWMEGYGKTVETSGGKTTRMSGVMSDITERKKSQENLRDSEERLQMLIKNLPGAGVFIVDHNLRYLLADGESLSAAGFASEDFVGKTIFEALPPELAATYEVQYRAALAGESFTHEHESHGGTYITRAAPLRSADGKIYAVLAVSYDISDRKKAEVKLRESEERLSLIMNSVEDYAIITTDTKGIINSWNPGAAKMFGYAESEILGSNCEILSTPEDRAAGIPAQEMKTAIERGSVEDERVHLRRDGSRFFFSGVIQPLKDGKLDGFVKIARDLTERLAAEQTKHDKEMLQKLVGAQEDERKRIARDLHDELGQLLTGLRLKLEGVRKLCEDDNELCGKVDETQTLAKQIDAGIDFLAWELRPAALDHLGLRAALEKYVREWSHYAGVSAELLGDANVRKMRFAPEAETNLYRIAQEALNNVHKHAKAKTVEVSLDKRGADLIVLIISDDGKGFDPESKMQRDTGIGLIGMKERAALIGGTLEIESAPGEGTTVYIRVPIAEKETGNDR